jgi:membrane-associated protease RseP (regulator of RpoE activity)
MDNVVVCDLIFLVLFTIFVIYFIRKNKSGLSREGIIYMYRTQAGVRAIEKFSKKYGRFLHSIKHFVIFIGFVLMAGMVWMLGQTLALYMRHPEITQNIKAPPIAPLIPYFPKLFGMSSFFPPFYFVYFIVAIAIVAIVHEFSHGIFMRLFKIKIKSTGLVFLGPILGAFVEQNEKSMNNKKRSEQMTVLAAGVFANVIFTLIFYALYVGFFFMAFTPSGYIFTSYGLAEVPLSSITGFEEAGNFTKVLTENQVFYLDEGLSIQREADYQKEMNLSVLVAYSDAPAVRSQMAGAIIRGDNVKIKNNEDLKKFLQTKEPGDAATIVTQTQDGTNTYEITLGEHPEDSTRAYLGVGHRDPQPNGFVQKFLSWFMSFREHSTYYEPNWNSEAVFFVYHFLWWIMIINLLVALFNMLPVGMLDGGRFFYLAILSVTKSESAAARLYKLMGYAILASFVIMMMYWLIGLF